MRKTFLYQDLFFVSSLLTFAAFGQDAVADNMLLYQRSNGAWPKHINEVNVDYTKALSAEEKKDLLADKNHNDATNKEIRYLVKANKKIGNKTCLKAAGKGIRYLLQMQKANGGIPQFYPNSSSYRGLSCRTACFNAATHPNKKMQKQYNRLIINCEHEKILRRKFFTSYKDSANALP